MAVERNIGPEPPIALHGGVVGLAVPPLNRGDAGCERVRQFLRDHLPIRHRRIAVAFASEDPAASPKPMNRHGASLTLQLGSATVETLGLIGVVAAGLSAGAAIWANGKAEKANETAGRASESAIEANAIADEALDHARKREDARTTPDIRVAVTHALMGARGETVGGRKAVPAGYFAKVTVVNDGETTEFFRELRVERPDGHGGSWMPEATTADPMIPPDAAPDVALAPHSSVVREFALSSIFDWENFVVVAVLASGRRFRSDEQVLDPDFLRYAKRWRDLESTRAVSNS